MARATRPLLALTFIAFCVACGAPQTDGDGRDTDRRDTDRRTDQDTGATDQNTGATPRGSAGGTAASRQPAAAPDGSIPAPPDVAAPPADAQRTASGLASRVLNAGAGSDRPGPRSQVTVHYTGWTTDGAMFDSSRTGGEPATFPLDRVIAGWTEGLQLMVVGESRRLWIPEALAYRGRPGRPAGMLVFDVELLAIDP